MMSQMATQGRMEPARKGPGGRITEMVSLLKNVVRIIRQHVLSSAQETSVTVLSRKTSLENAERV